MANRLAHLTKTGPAVGNAPPYLILKARGGFWLHWLHEGYRGNGHRPRTQAELALGLWDSQGDWLPVTEESCTQCGHSSPLCLFCGDEGIYLLDEQRLLVPVHLCSACGERVGGELGLYACCDGCRCDYWR